jgi:NAD(P)-dependent dehydrogenase (short-subunit alcohol dehydrogenase family)
MAADNSLFGLTGSKAMVIGGGQGMGESTSRFLAQAGCDVAVVDIERERAERVAGVVAALGRRGVPIVGNVLDDAQIPTIVGAAERQLGGIDVMVSIVGAAVWGSLLDTTAEVWDQQLYLNLRYFFLSAREVAAAMIGRGTPGAILGIASVDGQRASPMRGAYGAAKAGLISLVQTGAASHPRQRHRSGAYRNAASLRYAATRRCLCEQPDPDASSGDHRRYRQGGTVPGLAARKLRHRHHARRGWRAAGGEPVSSRIAWRQPTGLNHRRYPGSPA